MFVNTLKSLRTSIACCRMIAIFEHNIIYQQRIRINKGTMISKVVEKELTRSNHPKLATIFEGFYFLRVVVEIKHRKLQIPKHNRRVVKILASRPNAV